jgi:ribosomal protein S14
MRDGKKTNTCEAKGINTAKFSALFLCRNSFSVVKNNAMLSGKDNRTLKAEA